MQGWNLTPEPQIEVALIHFGWQQVARRRERQVQSLEVPMSDLLLF
jgi:hypothetical protein